MSYSRVRVGDICAVNKSSYSQKEKWKYVNYLDTGNITNNRIDEIQYIDLITEKLPSRAKRKVKHNSIIISTVRPNQLHYGIIKSQPENFLVSTGFAVIDVMDDTLDADYLYYVLTQKEIVAHLHAIAEQSTSAYPAIKPSDIQDLEILIPDLKTQKKIASLLISIDSRISINTKINENLEQQAQAIFKSWFVDFEPFGGAMPDDWKILSLGELCDSISKKHTFNKDELIFLNTGDVENGMILHNNYSEVSQMPGQAKKSIAINDILYSEIRPINKHFAYVNFVADDYVVSTKLMVLRAKRINPRRLYQFLTMPDTLIELQIEAESRSGTFPQIRFDNIQQLEMIVASEQVEKEYSERLNAIYSMIDSNNEENNRLSALRDTLLPKLMNGEIDVSAVKI